MFCSADMLCGSSMTFSIHYRMVQTWCIIFGIIVNLSDFIGWSKSMNRDCMIYQRGGTCWISLKPGSWGFPCALRLCDLFQNSRITGPGMGPTLCFLTLVKISKSHFAPPGHAPEIPALRVGVFHDGADTP